MPAIPIATYRLQFRPAFGFDECAAIAGYLSALGISDIYASPIFQARQGSQHGYDTLDPNRLSADLGSSEAWERLRNRRREHRMRWLQDIVPNHMAYDSGNPMLADVFEYGPDSPFFAWFDIFWDHPAEGLKERVMAPFLGESYTACLGRGELRLAFGAHGFRITYFDLAFPLRIDTYLDILDGDAAAVTAEGGEDAADSCRWLDLLDRLESLCLRIEPRTSGEAVKQGLWALYRTHPAIRSFITDKMARFNPTPGDIQRFKALDDLLAKQWFRLCHWRNANAEINYRRFFNINGLIALRQEDQPVFDHTHALPTRWVAQGIINGVRIDHIDGLSDPGGYLRRLRNRLGEQAYILVEKILAPDEHLPTGWPVQGTTGYDFAHWLNALFIRQENAARFNAIYVDFTGITDTFSDVVRMAKRNMLEACLAGDLENLCQGIKAISASMCLGDNFTRSRLKSALTEVLIHFPVYRTYIQQDAISMADRQFFEEATSRAIQSCPHLKAEIDFIHALLLDRIQLADRAGGTALAEGQLQAVRRFQQLSATLMAKGVEDTALYRYHRLLSLNEVGSDPSRFGCRVNQFHQFIQQRHLQWPHAMNTTATHDTKRGEDVRARLNVLSELPSQWEAHLTQWHALVQDQRVPHHGAWVPDKNTEYLLFQTLIGTWPPVGNPPPEFRERIQGYMIKATREAGVFTSWLAPREDYETALTGFIGKILHPAPSNRFLAALMPFCKTIAFFGSLNSLSQCLIKMTAPGIPDVYQGAELMHLDLVDPDNRRTVDFAHRAALLAEINRAREVPFQQWLTDLANGTSAERLKLFVIARGLAILNRFRRLFASGRYLPLTAVGGVGDNVVAFARNGGDQWGIVMVPRFISELVSPPDLPMGDRVWQDTVVNIPANAPQIWRNAFTGQTLPVKHHHRIGVGQAMARFPVALLLGEEVA